MELLCLFLLFVNSLLEKRRNGLDPLIESLKLKSNLKRSYGKSSSKPRILWTITNIKTLGTRSETIQDKYIKMNKIILLKNVNQILKRFGITLLVQLKVIIRLTIYLTPWCIDTVASND